ncbi:MAG: UDP-2,3-diacylglucosamine diphosphatase LpxI [Synergistaceae bacterium]|jgi:DUF1009 family protein|nr:UDP-2,3-diacylglucosamine diphosphatase LpxI [Synergistaceae bacterium]
MTVALIAGEGLLPELIASRLADGGNKPLVYAMRKDTGALASRALDIIPLSGARIGDALLDMARRKVKKAILAGFVPKNIIYSPEAMDETAKRFLAALSERDDHSLLGAIVSLLEKSGIEVMGYRDLLSDLLARNGLIAGRPPSPAETADVSYGVRIAESVLPLSFGQSIIVNGKAVVAVEAMEGTDAAVLRAGTLSRGGVVVKMIKQGQDERYDLPVVGPKTLKSMNSAKLTCLAVHTGWTLVLCPDEFREAASDFGISVIGVDY